MVLPEQQKNSLCLIFFLTAAGIAAWHLSYSASYFLPSIHDEFSYLFQARTFLLARVFNPPHPERLFFDTYHIINETVFASKYFPGFALTLLPFVAAGVAYAQPILFYTACLFMVFIIADRLYGKREAWLALTLASFSPQILMQSWFLLSHQTTALFLLLFLYAFIKWEREGAWKWAAFGSASLGLAYITRPLTAVGFAIPVIMYGAWREISEKQKKGAVFHILGWLIPVSIALMGLAAYNKSITGSYSKTPFDLYAEVHAPFHRYGFDTWSKYAEESKGPRVDKAFNEYYHNHMPTDGLFIASARLDTFFEALFGSKILGYLAFLFAAAALLKRSDHYARLLFSVWTALQLIHIPHWYPGILIFGSNYLYEVSALFILLSARGVWSAVDYLNMPSALKRFTLGFIVSVCFLQSAFYLRGRVADLHSQKSLKLWANKTVEMLPGEKQLVFIRYGSTVPLNQDILENVPTLDSPTILARDRGVENQKLRPYFPDYPFYLLDIEKGTVQRLPY